VTGIIDGLEVRRTLKISCHKALDEKLNHLPLLVPLLPIAHRDGQEGNEKRAIAKGNGSSHEPSAQTSQARLGPMKKQSKLI
jgi:hypothetical protein